MSSPDGIHEECCPFELIIHILSRSVEMVEQFSEPLHLYLLKSLATDDLDGAYDKSPQSWGEWNQVVKTNDVPCAEAE